MPRRTGGGGVVGDTALSMVNKGVRKYSGKIAIMRTNYANAKERAKDHYAGVGFVSEVTRAYDNAWDTYMVPDYEESMTADKAIKWAENWSSKMFGRKITPSV